MALFKANAVNEEEEKIINENAVLGTGSGVFTATQLEE